MMDEQQNDIVWQGKSWSLRVQAHTLADGAIHKSAFIDHPGSVVIVPWRKTVSGSEVLMLRQYRHALQDSILELPAGTRGWDEDLLLCTQRELREETGYRAERFDHLGQFWPAPGVTNEVMNVYLASGLQRDPLPQDVDEEIEVVPFRLDELFAMAVDGRLRDAKSVVGILRTVFYLREYPFNGQNAEKSKTRKDKR